MRKLLAFTCLIIFTLLQYGKVISYWHCRVAAPVDCDCAKQLLQQPDKDHTHTPLLIAKEKTEEVYLYHEVAIPHFAAPATVGVPASHYLAMMPAGYTASIFQPPRS